MESIRVARSRIHPSYVFNEQLQAYVDSDGRIEKTTKLRVRIEGKKLESGEFLLIGVIDDNYLAIWNEAIA